jgi:uncharacterized protein YbjT (DUF2867 family)
MKDKQVTLFGASGLIGGVLIKQLLEDPSISKIKIASRGPIKFVHEKSVADSVVVFSTIGSTKAKVNGDKNAYRRIDFDINLSIAKSCLKMKVNQFQLVSSGGADASSKNFYLKLKGEIEVAVFDLKLPSAVILRPSLLLGKRNEFRFGEKIAQILMPLFSFLFSDNYKPIKATSVAKSMLKYSKIKPLGNHVIYNKEMIKDL